MEIILAGHQDHWKTLSFFFFFNYPFFCYHSAFLLFISTCVHATLLVILQSVVHYLIMPQQLSQTQGIPRVHNTGSYVVESGCPSIWWTTAIQIISPEPTYIQLEKIVYFLSSLVPLSILLLCLPDQSVYRGYICR